MLGNHYANTVENGTGVEPIELRAPLDFMFQALKNA